ncbi:elicitor-responsive protein 3 [Humulus lupulus]|uniref:elicitor-responsive protein 3 n=1 Tax=Humulus lupulus TaxID=3486 RepID=UPI002B410E41|nr:elicitor-responsive protein 3 [Humulus lupulus]
MKGGILEVLLVNAEGIRHKHLVGRSDYYVFIECGEHLYRSKISSGEDEKAWWNEKFTFEFPMSDWKKLTHLKFRIMNRQLFSDGEFVGETIIYLGGIITEGCDRGFLEVKPGPYNVVLEDDTYRGQLKIGLKFISKKNVIEKTQEHITEEHNRSTECGRIVHLWRTLWWWSSFFYSRDSNKTQP